MCSSRVQYKFWVWYKRFFPLLPSWTVSWTSQQTPLHCCLPLMAMEWQRATLQHSTMQSWRVNIHTSHQRWPTTRFVPLLRFNECDWSLSVVENALKVYLLLTSYFLHLSSSLCLPSVFFFFLSSLFILRPSVFLLSSYFSLLLFLFPFLCLPSHSCFHPSYFFLFFFTYLSGILYLCIVGDLSP